jgi:hypothetical protein
MRGTIVNYIMIHLSYLDQFVVLTEKLKIFLKNDELESINHFSSNRERLLKIIYDYESKIMVLHSKNKTINNFDTEIFNEWKAEKTRIIDCIKKENLYLVDQLIIVKQKMKIELSNVFQTNQFHHAYLTHSIKL